MAQIFRYSKWKTISRTLSMDVSILDGSCRRCCCHPFAPKQDLFYMVFMPLHLQMSHFKTKPSQNVFFKPTINQTPPKSINQTHPPNKTHTHFPEQKLPPTGTNIFGCGFSGRWWFDIHPGENTQGRVLGKTQAAALYHRVGQGWLTQPIFHMKGWLTQPFNY